MKFFDNEGGIETSDYPKLGAGASNLCIVGPLPPYTAINQFPALQEMKSDLEAEKAAGDNNVNLNSVRGSPVLGWWAVQVIAEIAAQYMRTVRQHSFMPWKAPTT